MAVAGASSGLPPSRRFIGISSTTNPLTLQLVYYVWYRGPRGVSLLRFPPSNVTLVPLGSAAAPTTYNWSMCSSSISIPATTTQALAPTATIRTMARMARAMPMAATRRSIRQMRMMRVRHGATVARAATHHCRHIPLPSCLHVTLCSRTTTPRAKTVANWHAACS
jgi:hypothetical protein